MSATNLANLSVEDKTLAGLIIIDVVNEIKLIQRLNGKNLSPEDLDRYSSFKLAEIDITGSGRASEQTAMQQEGSKR